MISQTLRDARKYEETMEKKSAARIDRDFIWRQE